MSYSQWFHFYNGLISGQTATFYAERAHSDAIIDGSAIVGDYSLRVTAIDKPPRTAPLAWSYLTYHPFMHTPVKTHGVMRTLVRIESTSGAGRIHMGLNALHGNGTLENRGFGGGWGFVVIGTSEDNGTWDTLALSVYGNDEYGVYDPPTPVYTAPISLPQESVVALQVEFYSWPLDDFSGVRLVCSLGTEPDYSDLALMFTYTEVDFPALMQARTPGNFQHALMLRFDQGSIKALFDEFEFDIITVTTVP